MTKVKVDLELLRKYFGEHYDFETNPSQYLRYWEYDLEGRQHKEYEKRFIMTSGPCALNTTFRTILTYSSIYPL